MSLSRKFGLLILSIFALAAIGAIGMQIMWVDRLVVDQTTGRMAQNINSAWIVLEGHAQTFRTGVDLLSERPFFQSYSMRTRAELAEGLSGHAAQLDADFMLVLTPEMRVAARSDSSQYGDAMAVEGWRRALSEGAAQSGYATLPHEVIAKHAESLADRCRIEDEPMPGLILWTAAPIRDPSGNVRGLLVAADLLNGASGLVDTIRDTIFGDDTYEGKRVGTVTIFLGPSRVTTTVLKDSGERAIGTTVSDAVRRQVLEQGESWTGPAWVVRDWYISRYDPIRDASGNVIGMLYIGELQQISEDIKFESIATLASGIAGITVLMVLAAYVLSRKSLKQLNTLENTTRQFASGEMHVRADVITRDETGRLASAFNDMAWQIESDRTEMLRQKEEIERINKNYMDMLGFVTHEFRSTLASALFNVQLLQEDAYGKLTPDQKEGLELVTDSLNYLEEMTEGYLQLSRIERGELVVNHTHVHLRESVIEPVCKRLAPVFATKSRRLILDVPSSLVVYGDANLLRVVYENLASNAVKYGREGGEIRLEGQPISDDMARLSVWNEGPGIPPDRMAQLFGKFQRFDVDAQSIHRGTGLGLYIVKQIIVRHGGDIWLESEDDRGVRFVFTLPLPEAVQSAPLAR